MSRNNFTNNFFTTSNVTSSVVYFEKPRLALMKGLVYKLHGMLLITSYKEVDENQLPQIETYRQPLEGESLRPCGIFGEDDNIYFFPENRCIDELKLKHVVYVAKEGIIQLVGELEFHGIKFEGTKDVLDVNIEYYVKNNILHVLINSDAFSFSFKKTSWNKLANLSPADFTEIFALVKYMGVKTEFTASGPEDENLKNLAAQLADWTALACKGGILHDSNNLETCNDGTYTYSESLGKIRMTQAEFLQKFPDASKM